MSCDTMDSVDIPECWALGCQLIPVYLWSCVGNETGEFLHWVCWPVEQSSVASTTISTRQQSCSTEMLVLW